VRQRTRAATGLGALVLLVTLTGCGRVTVNDDPKPNGTSATGAPGAGASPSTSLSAADSIDLTKTYQIRNAKTGMVLDIPGDDDNRSVGTQVVQWENQQAKDQYWTLAAAPSAGYFTITNTFTGLALAVKDASFDNLAPVIMAEVEPARQEQQWQLNDAGSGRFWIINRNSGRALDTPGDDTATENGQPLQQWSQQSDAIDQRWSFEL
jgi:hypothetical protein